MTIPPLATEAKPALHFTGRHDLRMSLAYWSPLADRLWYIGASWHDAHERERAIRSALNEAAAAGRLK